MNTISRKLQLQQAVHIEDHRQAISSQAVEQPTYNTFHIKIKLTAKVERTPVDPLVFNSRIPYLFVTQLINKTVAEDISLLAGLARGYFFKVTSLGFALFNQRVNFDTSSERSLLNFLELISCQVTFKLCDGCTAHALRFNGRNLS